MSGPAGVVTATGTGRALLDRCAARRVYWAGAEAADPTAARRDRKYAAEKGWASEFDDPNVTVRASELEAVCRALLGEPDPTPVDTAQLDLFADPGRLTGTYGEEKTP